MSIVNLAYIRLLYNYLLGIEDDELENNFDINKPKDRALFFHEAAKEFEKLSAYTQENIINALEYVLSASDINNYWREIIPHDLPIDVSTDKREYVQEIYKAITGKNANMEVDTSNVTVINNLEHDWYLK